MWAVLTDPNKAQNRWQVDEFFATGRDTVNADMAYLGAKLPNMAKGHALDFGCGVGRLSQALAPHFDHVTGLDVAAAMIEQACHHNQHNDRVRYVHNPASHLQQFPDNSFDLVYSVITLQHIPSSLQSGYIKEFVRVCRPGGAIFFQLVATEPDKRWRFSWYPPTAWMRIKRFFRRATVIDATMTMNAMPKAAALALLQNTGARVVDVRPYTAAGELESWSYLVTKD